MEKAVEGDLFERAGAGYAERTAGSSETFVSKDALPRGLETPKDADLCCANEVAVGGGANGPGRFEWIAN